MTIEILAPAGGQEQLIAAVRSGADAVYLGTESFNARRNAANFSAESLTEAVRYCHGRGVRVYVTLNTLVKDAELHLLYKEIEMLGASGIDAVIVQDLAVAELFQRYCPSMPLHASTQMVIHNREGVLAAEEMGFSRVVLARELSGSEIAKICLATNIEIETFVHGAMCMSISGQCYLSSILGLRSGNRGLCAQPCRLAFQAGDRDYALSLKDMSHIAHIDELVEAGVACLKIEGRMKRPEYVAAAVWACREAVSGQPADLSDLQAVFSRSGFSDGYITGKRNLDMFGYRTREDVAAAKTVLGKVASRYRNELSRIPINMKLEIKAKQPSQLEVSDGKFIIAVQGDPPDLVERGEKHHAAAAKSLAKTGGTPFVLNKLQLDFPDPLMLPAGKLNAIRREALDKLLQARSRIIPKPVTGPFVPPPGHKRVRIPKLRVRLQNRQQFFAGIAAADKIYLPHTELTPDLIDKMGEKLIAELPGLVFPQREAALAASLEKLQKLGLKHICAGNIGTIRLAKRLGFVVHGGFDLNILNSVSLLKYQEMGLTDLTLAYEIRLSDAAVLGGAIERGIIGYGYLPLMIFRNCPAQGKKGCRNCSGRPEITDRTGLRFKLTCAGREYSRLHNPLPLYLADKKVAGADFITLYYTIEDKQECQQIWKNYLDGEPSAGPFTRGLYYKKLM